MLNGSRIGFWMVRTYDCIVDEDKIVSSITQSNFHDIISASCSVVFTADEGVRGGKSIHLKETMDKALVGCDCVRRVFVASRTGTKVNMEPGRDISLEEVKNAFPNLEFGNWV